MRLTAYLDALPADRLAYLVAECSWASDDPALARRFADALAACGKARVDAVSDTLLGGAKAEFLELLRGSAMGDGSSELDEGLRAAMDEVLAGYERKLERSARAKAEAVEARRFLKATFDGLEGVVTDQMMGKPFPATKAAPSDATVVALPPPGRGTLKQDSLWETVAARKSRRTWGPGPISLAELSWLLWATQGLRDGPGGRVNLRNVPSGGSRHPFETYLAAREAEGLEPGIWRYRPERHDLALVRAHAGLEEALTAGASGQGFVGAAPATFVWTAIPYRCEWRYCGAAHKPLLIDAGHLCQNLYLAAEAIGCGTCAIAAYEQEAMDRLLGVDGVDEFTVYLAPVGRRK